MATRATALVNARYTRVWVMVLVGMAGCQSLSDPVQSDRLIVPEQRVGQIKPPTTREDLYRIYGERYVQSCDILVGEGMSVLGTCLFPNTPDELRVEWKPDGTPERIRIAHPRASWRTAEGITVGSSLADVEAANGKSFRLTGFGWDYGGRSLSWEGGRLPDSLQLEFSSTTNLTWEEERQVQGDGSFSSSHPVLGKKGLEVQTLFIRW